MFPASGVDRSGEGTKLTRMANEVVEEAKTILETMLSKLGFEFEIEIVGEGQTAILNIESPHQALLIGKRGERLDDMQYLVNRILRGKYPDADRVRVDSGGYRAEQEERIAQKAVGLAEKVKESGRELWMNPMNSYHRRLVHNALVDDPEIETVSENTGRRDKKILIRLK